MIQLVKNILRSYAFKYVPPTSYPIFQLPAGNLPLELLNDDVRREVITWPFRPDVLLTESRLSCHHSLLYSGMGTVVEHPIFALGDNMEGHSRRNSLEIIDVDAHDEPPASTSSSFSQGPHQPRPILRHSQSFHPDAIISLVDDSDDEVQILSDSFQGLLRVLLYLVSQFIICQAVGRKRPIADVLDLHHHPLRWMFLLQFHPFPVDMQA